MQPPYSISLVIQARRNKSIKFPLLDNGLQTGTLENHFWDFLLHESVRKPQKRQTLSAAFNASQLT